MIESSFEIKEGRTQRGFAVIEFEDRYDQQCSLQKSSLAFEECIWFGVDDPAPQIMAKDACVLGISTQETTGWIPYQIPEQVSIKTRMHLTQEQVKKLLPYLQKFVETGNIL